MTHVRKLARQMIALQTLPVQQMNKAGADHWINTTPPIGQSRDDAQNGNIDGPQGNNHS